MRFVLLTEGSTEKQIAAFLRRWLDSKITVRIGIQTVNYRGWARLVTDVGAAVERYLFELPSDDLISVISLLDLYGPTFYPPSKSSPTERYEWGRQHMQSLVRGHLDHQGRSGGLSHRYRHFFAVHEVEAWMLAWPNLFHPNVRPEIEKLISKTAPEDVDFQNHPSQRLEEMFSRLVREKYPKEVTARRVFTHVDPEATAQRCPYLGQMLNELLDMAHEFGAVLKP